MTKHHPYHAPLDAWRAKIKSLDECARWSARLRRQGCRMVATNGCFDLIHAGHVRYLQQARARGDALVIGLNSDASVRALKGRGRPLIKARHRAELLAALACVDAVVVFPQKRATRFLEAVQPNVYVKGGDYRAETLDADERAALTRSGARIEFAPLVKGSSTTALIDKIRRLPPPPPV